MRLKTYTMRRGFILLSLAVGLCLCMSGCGGNAPAQTGNEEAAQHLQEQLELSEEEIAALCERSEDYPGLKSISITGLVEHPESIETLRAAFPGVSLDYSVDLCGTAVSGSAEELDLRDLESEGLDSALKTLEILPQLGRVSLSADRLTLEEASRFASLPSAPAVDYRFSLYGVEVSLEDEALDLNRVKIEDGGDALRRALPFMPRLKALDMENCGLSNEEMAALRDDFPQIKVVWRVNFGPYSARTDETRILASIKGYWLTGKDVEPLKYCTDVKYLDLGHNIIDDISFVANMPDLEVAILAINYWGDGSALANCKKLEYLEIFNTRCTDLSPLSELTELKYLNICWIKQLSDISPLYSLDGLEMLWIGCMTKVPASQIEEISALMPNTIINTTTDNPTLEGWRETERYALLREQMGYDLPNPYSK